MIIKTVEFEVDGVTVFATGKYFPNYGTIEDIEIDCEADIDDEHEQSLIYAAEQELLSSIDSMDELEW